MQSFGERLRHERETRNATIDEIAAASGIHRGFLEALERNEFDALPGGAFGKFYLRAYAEILDFDPEPLIVHYDKERRRDAPTGDRIPDEPALRRVEASLAKWRAELHGVRVAPDAAVEEEVDEPLADVELSSDGRQIVGSEEQQVLAAPVAEHVANVQVELPVKSPVVRDIPRPTAWRPHKLAATVAVAGVGLVVAAYFLFKSPPEAPPPPAEPVATHPAPVLEPVPTAPPVAPSPKQQTIPARPRPAPAIPPSSGMSIPESEVVRQFNGARVAVPGAVFAEGDVAAFSTRVRGGRPGESIRHVWMHRGRAVQSIRLRIGAADWRTHSTKTLWQQGPWSVEARDEAGRVLARASFVCERTRR